MRPISSLEVCATTPVYRDLGIAAATSGLATAHVIRMTAPFTEELSQRHHHNVEFQLVYVLKGWFKMFFGLSVRRTQG